MDEFAHFTPETKAAVLFIRNLPSKVLREAMDVGTPGFEIVSDFMGPDTNPNWITGTATETAYNRGLINEQELDRRNR